MKLSRASSYALAALAYLVREKPDAPVASHDIARAEGIPERFLLKLLKPLGDAGILLAQGAARWLRPPPRPEGCNPAGSDRGCGRATSQRGSARGQGSAALDKRLQAVCDEALALVASGWRR